MSNQESKDDLESRVKTLEQKYIALLDAHQQSVIVNQVFMFWLMASKMWGDDDKRTKFRKAQAMELLKATGFDENNAKLESQVEPIVDIGSEAIQFVVNTVECTEEQAINALKATGNAADAIASFISE